MIGKKGVVFSPVDVIAGFILIMSGVFVVLGNVNLGTVLAGLGLLIEAIKIMVQQGA